MYAQKEGVIAYFSMEIALDPRLPTYAGGLGVLAGDTIKSCADLGIPMIGVSILWEKGYFHQTLSKDGAQNEIPVEWHKQDFLTKVPGKIKIQIEGRDVYIQAWKHVISGINGEAVPIYFLDTNLEENSEWDKKITQFLYGGDRWTRLCQEMVLGIGGVRVLRLLGYDVGDPEKRVIKYHLNEGHASFLGLELLKESKAHDSEEAEEFHREYVRSKCVFTTHTPVPAGHDTFELQFVQNAFKDYYNILDIDCLTDGKVNMTLLALHLSGHINGVAKKHRDVSLRMFPGYQIDSITNGVHSQTWTSEPFRSLFDVYIPGWRRDNFMLRYSLSIPPEEIWKAHEEQKKKLIDYVNMITDAGLDYDVLTIGFARRTTAYKRPDLLFHDLERLERIGKGNIQIIMAGKAHPNDAQGKEMIKKIYEYIEKLKGKITVVYLPNYEMWLGQLLTSGVDVWLNTPRRPLEASGTSGMKAAHNGVINFSVLDGWWIEGHAEDITGWSIGQEASEQESDDDVDSKDLYDKLENKILKKYYQDRNAWIQMMLHGISHNASFFNTQRMVLQYVTNCYFN